MRSGTATPPPSLSAPVTPPSPSMVTPDCRLLLSARLLLLLRTASSSLSQLSLPLPLPAAPASGRSSGASWITILGRERPLTAAAAAARRRSPLSSSDASLSLALALLPPSTPSEPSVAFLLRCLLRLLLRRRRLPCWPASASAPAASLPAWASSSSPAASAADALPDSEPEPDSASPCRRLRCLLRRRSILVRRRRRSLQVGIHMCDSTQSMRHRARRADNALLGRHYLQHCVDPVTNPGSDAARFSQQAVWPHALLAVLCSAARTSAHAEQPHAMLQLWAHTPCTYSCTYSCIYACLLALPCRTWPAPGVGCPGCCPPLC